MIDIVRAIRIFVQGAVLAVGAGLGMCAQATTVPYTSFDGAALDLVPWEGSRVVVMTQSPALDPAVMMDVVDTLDAAWEVYYDLTGQTPFAFAGTTRNGRATIAEVPTTCGAGCGYLGANGIEILPTYFDLLYSGVRESDAYDQVLFYELGRNFWFYGDQLGTTSPMVTGFAIANRFVSMEEVGAAGAPFDGTEPFDAFKTFVTSDQLAAYQNDPLLNWTTAIAGEGGVPGRRYGDAPSLSGAMFYQIYADHGYAAYRDFYTNLTLLPGAATPSQEAYNFLRAAYLATGQNYVKPFKAQAYASAVPLPGAAGALLFAVAGLLGAALRRKKGA